jgi:hypothetical protein
MYRKQTASNSALTLYQTVHMSYTNYTNIEIIQLASQFQVHAYAVTCIYIYIYFVMYMK